MTDEQITQLFELKQRLDAGVITQETFDQEVAALKGEPQVASTRNNTSPKQAAPKNGKKRLVKWILIGVSVLAVAIAAIVIINHCKDSTDNTEAASYPAYQPPEWTPTCGRWIKDEHSVLLYLKHNYNGDVFVRYYPGDRFEVSVPNVGVDTWGFKLKETNGETIKIAAKTKYHIQGTSRVEIDDPESVMKFYRLLDRGDFIIRTAWLIETKVGNEGCGLAEFVWHKFTEHDPYTNEMLGKPVTNTYYTSPEYREYDVDPQEGMTTDEVLKHLIRIDMGDGNAADELLNEILNAL